MILISSCSRLCPIYWSQVLNWEWRCSWSSADRRCSNYIWVINNIIAYKDASYIRDLTVISIYITILWLHWYVMETIMGGVLSPVYILSDLGHHKDCIFLVSNGAKPLTGTLMTVTCEVFKMHFPFNDFACVFTYQTILLFIIMADAISRNLATFRVLTLSYLVVFLEITSSVQWPSQLSWCV